MSMHALSRDTEAFPHHCIYAQVDVPRGPDDAPEDEGEEEDGDGFEGDEETIEIRFVPDDPASGDPTTKLRVVSPPTIGAQSPSGSRGHYWTSAAGPILSH